MRFRFLTFVVLGAILVALGEWSIFSKKHGPLESLDHFWLEFCVGFTGEKISDPAVTVVRINDDYEPLSIGEETPAAADGRLSRLDYATILGFLGKLDPKAIAFLPTPTFDENLVLNQTDVVPLEGAAMQLPRFLVAANVSNDGEEAKETSPLPFPKLKVNGNVESVLEFTRSVRKPDGQLMQNADPAIKSIESARGLTDNGVLRIPLIARYQDSIVPSIALSAVALYDGVPVEEATVDFSAASPVVILGERTIPIEKDGTMIFPAYAGVAPERKSKDEQDDKIPHFTALTVDELAYTGEEEDEVAKRILASFQSKFDSISRNLVVIGYDRTGDRRFTLPNGNVISETMLLARVIATIQSGRFIDWWPSWARWIATAAIFVLAVILFGFGRGKFVIGWFLSLLAFFAMMVLVFKATLSWTPPWFAFSLFLLMLLIGLIVPLSGNKPNAEAEA
ncbi:MAG: hypothetical protein CMO55_28270 [Verrucomicrobiales bacterium]|nr:hypothetical protein [Verrucomicrobiales bacterium]